jgi:hypothetical protein
MEMSGQLRSPANIPASKEPQHMRYVITVKDCTNLDHIKNEEIREELKI